LVQLDWAGLLPGLAAGRFDVVASGVTRTAQRLASKDLILLSPDLINGVAITKRRGDDTIKGWADVLPMMKPGAEWQVFIPGDLAYGPSGRPPKIGPSAVLIFDMELVSVAPTKPASPAVTPTTPKAPTAAAAPGATVSGPTAVSGQIIRVPSAEEMKQGKKIEVITNAPPSQ